MPRSLAVVFLTLVATPLAAADRPNVLVVITDDQRFDALGVVQKEQGDAARFPWLETPNLDRLAAEGTRFRNAFVTCSLCAPSRAAYLTGRYNHANGVRDNKTPFPADAVTYASLLREAGYATGYVGKWHMDGQEARPGFDWSASFTGQGKYIDCPVLVNGEKTPTKGWIDDVSTDYALDFLGKQTDDKPFCLVVGYKSVHGPRNAESVPERLAGLYEGAQAGPSPNADAKPPYLTEEPPADRRGSRRAERTNNVYFQLLRGVDENVGRMLAALESAGRLDNTVVVFASDNGYFLGDHGIGDKRAAYEESLRIPLLIRAPGGKKGHTVDSMTLNIDLAPTLLDLAGLTPPESMHGRSLRPLLEGQTPADWRTAYLYEYFEEPPYKVPANFALRTTSAKLILYPGHDDWTELFDLAADPHEKNNLAADPHHATMLKRMRAEFDRQAKAVALPADVLK